MSNTRKLGVWAGRTIPSFRSGASASRRLTPKTLPLARVPSAPPPPAPFAVRVPLALQKALHRRSGERGR